MFLAGAGCGVLIGWAAPGLSAVDWRPIVPPLEQARLVIRTDAKGNGRFGAPRSGHRFHRGVDIEAPLGSPVRAIRSGTVIEIGSHRGLGRFIELEHRHQLDSLYAHLDTVAVSVGERVRQGQVIATVGKTGNARHPWITPHLHLEVHQGGSPIDPATLGLAFVEPAQESRDTHADGG